MGRSSRLGRRRAAIVGELTQQPNKCNVENLESRPAGTRDVNLGP